MWLGGDFYRVWHAIYSIAHCTRMARGRPSTGPRQVVDLAAANICRRSPQIPFPSDTGGSAYPAYAVYVCRAMRHAAFCFVHGYTDGHHLAKMDIRSLSPRIYDLADGRAEPLFRLSFILTCTHVHHVSAQTVFHVSSENSSNITLEPVIHQPRETSSPGSSSYR